MLIQEYVLFGKFTFLLRSTTALTIALLFGSVITGNPHVILITQIKRGKNVFLF